MKIKSIIPWQFKIAGKIFLSRLPLGYRAWQKIGLFVHGNMDDPSYAFSVFNKHFNRVDFPGKQGGFTALELGPGDSLFSAVIAKAFGAGSTYLVDTGKYAQDTVTGYEQMAEYLAQKGQAVPEIACAHSLEDVLNICNCRYVTNGLQSLREIPEESIDFIWSHAVLEHIRKEEFFPTLLEFRRILKPEGMCSHRVDLKDHLGGGLNHLRFSDKHWESKFIMNAGFYTNRIRYGQMLQLFERAGFSTKVIDINSWDRLPISRRQLSKEFLSLPDYELCISGFDIILKLR